MKKITFLFILFCTILNAQTEINNLSITDLAITEMQNENYTKAILMFDKAVKSNPKDKEALQYRAFSKYKIKKFNEALIDINKAIAIDTICSSCYETRAEIKYKLNDLKGCVKDYEKAFEIEPILANSENYYQVAKSKLITKPKPSLGVFQPTATFIEKIITTKLNFTDFYNQYYDNIESYTDEKSLTYNEKTNEHDLPRYTAEVICVYKGAKIYFTLISKTEKDQITDVTVRVNCVCEWFNSWKNLQVNGFKEEKRIDKNGVLEIWGNKQNLKTKYSANIKRIERQINIWQE